MSDVATAHPSLVKKFNLSLKIDTGLLTPEAKDDDNYEENTVSPSSGFATPKGPLPTLLFARKHSMNVPRAVVKCAEAEEKKVESLVTQVKKTGPSTPTSRPRTPSSRQSQDVLAIATAAAASSPTPTSPTGTSGGVLTRLLSWGRSDSKLDEKPAPVAPPSPSAVMSPTAGKARPRTFTQTGLLGDQQGHCAGRKCLVLDLDETLVHSSFRPTKTADFIIPVEIDGHTHQVYVAKRPHVDDFLKRMGRIYEIVIFTASLPKYANPLLDVLDRDHGVIQWRLYREHCTYSDGCYVKDLSRLGRPMNEVLIVDNAPYSYRFQPENGIASDTWNDDPHCCELQTMAEYLESIVHEADLRHFTDEWNNSAAKQDSR